MKWTALALALAAAPIFAAPAAAQVNTVRGMANSLHGNDDRAGCENREYPLERRTSRCDEAVKEGHFGYVLRLAWLQGIAGQYDAALASVARYTDRLPDIPTTYASTNSKDWIVALEIRSEIYAQMGRFEDASRDGDEIAGISVDGADADNGRCWLRAVAGKELEQALDFCNKAVARKPEIGAYLDSRGLVYFKMGRFQDALSDYNAAIDKNSDAATSRYARGVVKLRLGDKDGGQKDIDDAKEREVIVAQEMAGRGVSP
jgi:tetratricopeptide (TPR) repeat protein